MSRRNCFAHIILLIVLLSSCGNQEYIVTNADGTKETVTKKEVKEDKKFARKYGRFKNHEKRIKEQYPERFTEAEYKRDTLVKIKGREATIQNPTVERPEVISPNGIKVIHLPGDSIFVQCPDDTVRVEYVVKTETVEVPKIIKRQYSWWQRMFFWFGVIALGIFILKSILSIYGKT